MKKSPGRPGLPRTSNARNLANQMARVQNNLNWRQQKTAPQPPSPTDPDEVGEKEAPTNLLFHLIYLSSIEELQDTLKKDPSLINQQDEHGNTLLHYAVGAAPKITRKLLEPKIQLLLGYNPDLNTQDNAGNTPVHLAADTGGNAYVFEAILKEAVKPGRYNFDKENKEHHTAIHVAAAKASAGHIQLVIGYAPKRLEIENRFGVTPLITAVQHGNAFTLEALVAAGVDLNHCDIRGKTALSYAIEKGHLSNATGCARLLVAAGTNMALNDYNGFIDALPLPKGSPFFNLTESGTRKQRLKNTLKFARPLETMDGETLQSYVAYFRNPHNLYPPPSHIPAGTDLRGIDFSGVTNPADLSHTTFGKDVLVDKGTNFKGTHIRFEELANCKGVKNLQQARIDVNKKALVRCHRKWKKEGTLSSNFSITIPEDASPLEKALLTALAPENQVFLKLAIQQNLCIEREGMEPVKLGDWYDAFKTQLLMVPGEKAKEATALYPVSHATRLLLRKFDQTLATPSNVAWNFAKDTQYQNKVEALIIPLYQLDIDTVKAMSTAQTAFPDVEETIKAATTIQSFVRMHQARRDFLTQRGKGFAASLTHEGKTVSGKGIG